MFNRTVVVSPKETHYVDREIHIHRAPTDKSVKLLREMENSARNEVIKSVAVRDNRFECVIHQVKDFLSETHCYRAIWNLNGERRTTEYVCSPDIEMQDAMIELRDNIAKDIATVALAAFLNTKFN